MSNIQKRLNYLKYLFGYKKEFNVTENNIDNIYFKMPMWCCEYTPQVMINNIGPFKWNKMIKILVELYESKLNIETRFFSLIKNYDEKTLEINNDDYEANELILNYIRCRSNIKILIQFSNRQLNFTGYNLYCHKKISLQRNAIECLIYQIFCLTSKFKSFEEIKKYVDLLNIKKDKIINIYLYENKGKADNLNVDLTCDFISPNFISSIMWGELLFNKNSLNLLNEMLLERFLTKLFDRTRLILNTYKKILLIRKITLLEQSKFLVVSGSILSSYGLRLNSDIDIMISNFPNYIDKLTLCKISDLFLDKNKKLFFMDAFHPKVNWLEHWKEWHPRWGSYFGANNILECIYNPKFHYYFCGIKMIILEAEIIRRNLRERPAAIADLLMYNRLLNKNIKIFPIPKSVVQNINKFKNTVSFWIKTKYNLEVTKEELDSVIFE
jgi:hypothetical protein